jgi:hypothetical protein
VLQRHHLLSRLQLTAHQNSATAQQPNHADNATTQTAQKHTSETHTKTIQSTHLNGSLHRLYSTTLRRHTLLLLLLLLWPVATLAEVGLQRIRLQPGHRVQQLHVQRPPKQPGKLT